MQSFHRCDSDATAQSHAVRCRRRAGMQRLIFSAPWLLLLCAYVQFAGAANVIDYEQPRLLTGTIYETASGTNKVLFTFKRTGVRSNSAVHVTRDFLYPDGNLAAQELAVFDQGKLVSFHLDERQTGA